MEVCQENCNYREHPQLGEIGFLHRLECLVNSEFHKDNISRPINNEFRKNSKF